MGNFNDMQPCAHCGQVRNTQSMDCTNGLWFCAQCARDHSHLARMAEAHEPDLIRAEIEAKVAGWAKPKRSNALWKVAPLMIIIAALWWTS